METSEIHPAQESLAWGSEKKLPADEDRKFSKHH
jgi:hypothetical protein